MEKHFKVGDIITLDPTDEKVQRGVFRFCKPPFTVTRIWGNSQTYVDFIDSKGREETTWLPKRFIHAEQSYDPTQMGDTDEDI